MRSIIKHSKKVPSALAEGIIYNGAVFIAKKRLQWYNGAKKNAPRKEFGIRKVPVKAMDCKKCGKELLPDSKFCLYCGEPVVEEAPTQTDEIKKKGKAKFWLISAAAVLFAAGILVAVFFADITIWFERNILPPEMLMAKAFVSVAQDAGLGEISNGFSVDTPHRYTMGIYVDEDLMEFLSATEGNYEWLTELNLQLLTGKEDDLSRTKMSLLLKEESLVSLDVFENAEKAWLGVPELNEQYLEIPKEDLSEDQLNALTDKMPSAEELTQILRTYGTILFDSIHDVTKKNATLTLDGIGQDVLKLTATIRPEDSRRAFSKMAQKLKEDDTAKKLLADLAGENALAEAIKQLENLAEDAPEIQLIASLDDRNKLTGLELTNGSTLFYWAKAAKGDLYASRLVCGDLVLTGNGTSSGQKKTGEHILFVGGKKILTYRLKDFALNKNGFTGSLAFPLDGMTSEGDVAGLMGLSLELSSQKAENTDVISLHLAVGEKALLGLTFGVERANDFSAEIPAAVVPIDEVNEVEAWAENLDWSSILQRLVAAGVPLGAMGSLE